MTLARAVECVGVGLHSGRPVRLRVCPGRAGQGLVFRRTDLATRRPVDIPAHIASVTGIDHATTLTVVAEGVCHSVRTVEHLLAALAGLGIDSAILEVDADEVPVLDGSARPWVDLLRSAGTRGLATPRVVRRIVKPVVVEKGESRVEVRPSNSARLSCSIDFEHPVIGRQSITTALESRAFDRELADARTFGFLRDVEAMRAARLARGASFANTVVLDETSVVSGVLRSKDEFVRHKALDLVGDLALTGAPLLGHVIAHRAGHALHVAFGRELLSRTDAWVLEELHEETFEVPAAAMPTFALAGLPRTLLARE